MKTGAGRCPGVGRALSKPSKEGSDVPTQDTEQESPESSVKLQLS